MYSVIVSVGSKKKEAHPFPDKPKAMNWAVRLLKAEGREIKITIEDAAGVVFDHNDIARACEAVRL